MRSREKSKFQLLLVWAAKILGIGQDHLAMWNLSVCLMCVLCLYIARVLRMIIVFRKPRAILVKSLKKVEKINEISRRENSGCVRKRERTKGVSRMKNSFSFSQNRYLARDSCVTHFQSFSNRQKFSTNISIARSTAQQPNSVEVDSVFFHVSTSPSSTQSLEKQAKICEFFAVATRLLIASISFAQRPMILPRNLNLFSLSKFGELSGR